MHSFPMKSLALVLLAALLGLATPVGAQTTVTVTVSPSSFSTPINGTRQLSAQVSGTANTAVTWSVNGVPGGNATVGTVDATGKYTAPALPPSGYAVTIRATSAANTASYANCAATVRNQIPWLTAVTPSPLALGAFSLTVTGSRFVQGAQVRFNGTGLPTTYVSSTQLVATGTATQAGPAIVTVVNPGPEAVSVNFTVQVVSTLLVSVSPTSHSAQVGSTTQFQATVSNSSNTAVTWRVNGVAGGNATVGTINSSGVYTAPASLPFIGTVTVSALSAADNFTTGSATVSLYDPQLADVGRFLEQATFGPNPQLIARVRQVGIDAFVEEQFALPESSWPSVATGTRSDVVDRFYYNAAAGQDQLRQRTIYALSQIWVVALNKNTNGNEIIPWLQVLSRNAFGNYRTLMQEMTLNASMGKYLDLVNSNKPAPNGNGGANENYPRELMQLFTIGLYELNQDGSNRLDAQGRPIPTYTQTNVRNLALALTGWTYPTAPGQTPRPNNYSYYPGNMESRAANHDTTQKTLLNGYVMPPGRTALQDLNGALDNLFAHPNLGPFVATRLIRAFTTSNPSPGYIQRVAAAFDDDGQGVRGNMKAVLRAILLDSEARPSAPPAEHGKLRSPFLHFISFQRAMQGAIPQTFSIAYLFYGMGEPLLDAPSVFGHYSPLYRIPHSPLFGPEFQIYTPTEAINRTNLIHSYLNQGGVDISPFVAIAGNSTQLINAVDNTFLYGRMSAGMRSALHTALQSSADNRVRALTALYLTATSGEYTVQH
jgi:hypothetical protein